MRGDIIGKTAIVLKWNIFGRKDEEKFVSFIFFILNVECHNNQHT